MLSIPSGWISIGLSSQELTGQCTESHERFLRGMLRSAVQHKNWIINFPSNFYLRNLGSFLEDDIVQQIFSPGDTLEGEPAELLSSIIRFSAKATHLEREPAELLLSIRYSALSSNTLTFKASLRSCSLPTLRYQYLGTERYISLASLRNLALLAPRSFCKKIENF